MAMRHTLLLLGFFSGFAFPADAIVHVVLTGLHDVTFMRARLLAVCLNAAAEDVLDPSTLFHYALLIHSGGRHSQQVDQALGTRPHASLMQSVTVANDRS